MTYLDSILQESRVNFDNPGGAVRYYLGMVCSIVQHDLYASRRMLREVAVSVSSISLEEKGLSLSSRLWGAAGVVAQQCF